MLALPPVAELEPDRRLARIHHDWLEAGEHAQRTVAGLSQQLRRFLDHQAWLENRRIMELLRSIESGAIAVRDAPPPGAFLAVDDTHPAVDLPMELKLFAPTRKASVDAVPVAAGEEDLDAASLYAQFVVDKAQLRQHVRQSLQQRAQVTLAELLQERPVRQGLAELTTYLQIAAEDGAAVSEDEHDFAVWPAEGGQSFKRVRMPRVIFTR